MFTARFYVFLFFLVSTITLGWFLLFLLIFDSGWVFSLILFSLYVGHIYLVWNYTSSPRLTFIEGMERITAANMSGCANITMIYIFPVLSIVMLLATYHTFLGLKRGKEYTQKEWQRIVREHQHIGGFRLY